MGLVSLFPLASLALLTVHTFTTEAEPGNRWERERECVDGDYYGRNHPKPRAVARWLRLSVIHWQQRPPKTDRFLSFLAWLARWHSAHFVLFWYTQSIHVQYTVAVTFYSILASDSLPFSPLLYTSRVQTLCVHNCATFLYCMCPSSRSSRKAESFYSLAPKLRQEPPLTCPIEDGTYNEADGERHTTWKREMAWNCRTDVTLVYDRKVLFRSLIPSQYSFHSWALQLCFTIAPWTTFHTSLSLSLFISGDVSSKLVLDSLSLLPVCMYHVHFTRSKWTRYMWVCSLR